MSYGTCKECGCTDETACYHPEFGPCWWVDETHELCSHCVELKDDPAVERAAQNCITNTIKVVGRPIDSGKVQLLALEKVCGYTIGQVVHTCSRASYKKMTEPRMCRILPSGRVECVCCNN